MFVIYIRGSIALRFEPFKRMYENGSKIALNSTCSKGFGAIAEYPAHFELRKFLATAVP